MLMLVCCPNMAKIALVIASFASLLRGIVAAALASSSPGSPWAPAQWRLNLNVGREPGTSMPVDWGASGARLVLPIDVTVESESFPSPDETLGGGPTMAIRPNEHPTFINDRGQQTIAVREGGWKVRLPQGKRGHAALLRFWLDFETEATRNDVTLPAERVYFNANCWREEELERGGRALAPILAEAEYAQQLVQEQLSHDTGDRRLDGTDPLETALAFKDMAELVRNRDDKMFRLKDAERVLPRNAEALPRGAWPGTTELLAIGSGTMAVRHKTFFADEFHVLGTWEAKPLAVKSKEREKV